VTNGLALCDLCQMKATKCFEVLPIYFNNLARWRPGSAGSSRPVPGSREPTNVGRRADDRVSRALDEIGADLTTWAQCLADDRLDGQVPASNDETSSVRVACWFLNSNLASVATLDWCGEMVRKLGEYEEYLGRLTLQVAPGWYAGACTRCEVSTYVVPGLTWVTCGGCGATTYARDHLDNILKEARGWVARPMRLAEAVVALVDTELSVSRLHKRISKWGEREQVEVIRRLDADGDACGPKRYRLGDVLDRLQAEGATRLEPKTNERIGA
jgi:hypothetical protein